MNRDAVADGKCVATGRRVFATLRAALRSKKKKRRGVYRCDDCKGWHLVTTEHRR